MHDSSEKNIEAQEAIERLDNLTDQPHSSWATLRSGCPVAQSGSTTPTDRPTFYVTTWADAETVLRDSETFSSAINGEHIGRFMGPIMLALDGDKHRSYRSLVAVAFRPSQLAKWEEKFILPTINQLLDRIIPYGSADLVAEVTSLFPAQVICRICDIPPENSAQLLRWAHDIHRGPYDVERGMAASRALRAYLEPIVEERRTHPGDDLISDILQAEIDGEKLNDEEVYGFLRLLLPAGSESTYRAMGNILVTILATPGLLDQILSQRSLLPAIIEESLRRDSSLSLVSRVATRDTVLGGCGIPAGSAIRVFTGSANRDDTRYEAPVVFNPDRPRQRHITFGAGPHQCLGQHLARLELRMGLNAILDRLTNLRLDPSYAPPAIEGFAFRGPKALHVLFKPT